MRTIYLLPLLSIFFFGCPGDDDVTPANLTPICGELIQIVNEIPDAADVPQAISATADGLCLSITIGFSGCSTDTWQMELFTTGDVAESLPTQTSVAFVFNDAGPDEDQLCQAFFSQTFEFDLTPYIADALPTILRIEGTDLEVAIE
ncbi:MAG: hypothetical protein AAF741_02105 [Bacteroidota bacterium]